MASRKLAQHSTIREVFETTFRKTSHSDRSEMWITKLGQIMKKDQIKSYGPTCSNISTMVFKATFRRSKIETKPNKNNHNRKGENKALRRTEERSNSGSKIWWSYVGLMGLGSGQTFWAAVLERIGSSLSFGSNDYLPPKPP